MNQQSIAHKLLAQEAKGLLSRLNRLKPFSLQMPMVAAATISPEAQAAIENFLATGRRELRGRIFHYLHWLQSPEGEWASPEEAQRRLTFLRLRFNAVLSQLDIFADVLNQRSEHENGVWLAGLDAIARDALTLPGNFFKLPPMVCYLDRGIGAAIRRVKTRLPGGKSNPVAVIRIPRERMVGSGIASSLIHEVGHQASVLLGLIESLRPVLRQRAQVQPAENRVWQIYERWISEILADFWSVARVGIASTLGLMGVVSLPRVFVFHVNLTDPHPTPWIRVKISAAIGQALFPHPQWSRLTELWEALYPLKDLAPEKIELFEALEATLPELVQLIIHHRPQTLRGKSLKQVLALPERQPYHLAEIFSQWKDEPALIYQMPPSLVFAGLGQARADGVLEPEKEAQWLVGLLNHWAQKRPGGAHLLSENLL